MASPTAYTCGVITAAFAAWGALAAAVSGHPGASLALADAAILLTAGMTARIQKESKDD